ncbi:MAG: flagellar hook-length control protein FliK [Syntrophales bacterium]|nr:flagellar hook-length control protein FliK [Syntrophales bacterium]
MQAIGVTPPVLNLKSLTPGRAEAYPAMDMFQSLLQQRILSRGYASSNASTGPLSRASLKAQVSQARPVSSNSASSRLFNKMPKFTVHTASTKGSRDPLPLHITEKLSNRTQAQRQEKSSTSMEKADSSSRILQKDRRSRTLGLIRGKSDLAKSTGAVVPDGSTEMPPALKALKEILNQQPGQALKVSQDQIPQVKAFLLKAGLPAEQVEKLFNSSSFETKGLTAADLQAAWQEACHNSREQALAAQVAQGTPAVGAAEMPAALKSLMDLVNQQPGQNLKVPPDRLPEVESFLLRTGISPDQLEKLLNSPRFQEQGLTAAELQAAWQNSIKSSLASQGVGQNGSLTALTSQSDYREIWENLVLPPQSLADLRLELQQLGVAPEAVAKLTEQNYPQGLPLTQVWQLLQQAGKNADSLAHSPLLLNGGEQVGKWRQLLEQAGMDQEVAQSLVSGSSPTTREELRTGLLKMAPPAVQLQGQEIPKPLYLPQSVRVRAFPMWQQPDLGQGGSGDSSSGNWTQNFAFSSQTQQVNLAGSSNLNNFLALLTGDTNLNTGQFTASEVTGSPTSTVNALLTPEARAALWSQVQAGVLGNLSPGVNQVTLTLNPPEMGNLHLSLNVRGDLVEVTAIASHAAVAEAGAAGVQQLAQALNQQGLTLTQFQFHHQDEAPSQSNLAFFQNSGDQRQAGKKGADRWEQPPNPRRRRWAGGIDCFA